MVMNRKIIYCHLLQEATGIPLLCTTWCWGSGNWASFLSSLKELLSYPDQMKLLELLQSLTKNLILIIQLHLSKYKTFKNVAWVLIPALKLKILDYQYDYELSIFLLVWLSFCLRFWEDRRSNNSLSEIPIPVSQMDTPCWANKTPLFPAAPRAGVLSAITEKHPHLFCAIR